MLWLSNNIPIPDKCKIICVISLLICVYLRHTECFESDRIEVSAVRIRGYAPTDSAPSVLECPEMEEIDGTPHFDCNLDIRRGEGFFRKMQILNNTLQINPEIASGDRIVLMCNATCPAMWQFYPAKVKLTETFKALEVHAHRYTELDQTGNIELLHYYVNLTLQSSSNELTGRYVCECVRFSHVQKYVNVYLEEVNKPLLVNAEDSDLYYKYPTSDSELRFDLPCGVSRAGQVVFLYIQEFSGQAYTEIFPNASIQQDPLTGFILRGRKLPSIYDYFWICSSTNDTAKIQEGVVESVTTILLPKKRKPVVNEFSKPHSFHTDHNMACCRMTCGNCSVEGIQPPSMAAYSVKNSITAALLKPLLSQDNRRVLGAILPNSYCTPIIRLGINESMPTERELMSGELDYTLKCYDSSDRIPSLDLVMSPCSIIPLQEVIQSGFIFVCDNNGYRAFEYERHTQLISVDDYFHSLKGKRSILNTTLNFTNKRNMTMRLTMLPTNLYTPIYPRRSNIMLLVTGTEWQYFRNGPNSRVSKIYRVPSDSDLDQIYLADLSQKVATEGEIRCFLCEASRYHFATGIIWTVNWENGSRVYHTNEGVTETRNDETKYYNEDKNMPPRLTSKFCPTLRPGMDNITCHAPMWSSPEWKILSINFPEILKSLKPSLVADEQNDRNISVFNQIPVQLSCKFKTGSPLEVEWFINDMIVQRIQEPTPSCLFLKCAQIVNNFTFNVLNYNTLFEHGSAINVTCLGTNILGSVAQSFWLIVIDNTVPTILGSATEKLEFEYGELHKKLNCSAVGFPSPDQIAWHKQGYNLSEISIQNGIFTFGYGNTTTSILEIPEISMDSAGTYICQVSNKFQETVVKEFQITVKKSSTLKIVVIGSVLTLILLAAVFVYLLIKFKKENPELKKLEINFRRGGSGGYPMSEDGEDARSRHLTLPYTGDHEIDEALFKKCRKLDEGFFGEVWLSELRTVPKKRGFSRVFKPITIWCGVLESDNCGSNETKAVAVKCLSEAGRSVDQLKVLCSELKMMMLVKELGSDPNVVTFLGASTKNFQKLEVNIIMEFCENGSVKNYIKDHIHELYEAVDEYTERACPIISLWASQIARGMKFLSSNGILHIDLAARNVLLTHYLVAKVADLGLSRNLYGREIYNRRRVPLPELWAAPEALDQNLISVKSDVWSYGVTVWELFSKGSLPSYGAGNVIEHLENGYRLSCPRTATSSTYDILLDCWNWEPDFRPDFQNLINFFEDLSEERLNVPDDNINETTTLSASNPALQEPDMAIASGANDPTGDPDQDSVTAVNVQIDIQHQEHPENDSDLITAWQSGNLTDFNSGILRVSDWSGLELIAISSSTMLPVDSTQVETNSA